MPHSGRLDDSRSDSTSLAKWTVSPASTGLIQRRSRNPGDGPHTATSSPRAVASRARRCPSATKSFMQTEPICHPDAASPPPCGTIDPAGAAQAVLQGIDTVLLPGIDAFGPIDTSAVLARAISFGASSSATPVSSLRDAAKNLRAGARGATIGDLVRKPVRPIDETASQFYVSLDVADQPGVLAKIAGVFGDHRVSIQSMQQKGQGEGAREYYAEGRAAAEIGRLWAAIERSVKAIRGTASSSGAMHKQAA